MSQQKSGKVNSPNPEQNISPLSKTDGLCGAGYEEAMDIEQPLASDALNSNDRQELDRSAPVKQNQVGYPLEIDTKH
ncbi:unnamed protein product [Echinostoma caproni]|uniref:ELM2 domain-containing protein n=1 Tax=Echinostoma caproni TaxID=27848 RepID=A0A183A2B5_9TREM|nr:unnamed protein product [Echinostoma caproni]